MAQLETAGLSSSQQHPPATSSPQRFPAVDSHISSQSFTTQENQAKVHDFLSLCGTGLGRPSSAPTTLIHGSQQSSATQDFLQPLQKSLVPAGSNISSLRTNGYALGPSKSYLGSHELGGGQQSCYPYANGSFDLKENFPLKYGSTNISFGPRSHVTPALPLNKHWPQQAGTEVFDGSKRLSRVPSEEDDDEDDESFEQFQSAKRDVRYQKGESLQSADGRNQDKGVTPRSKHSATEQRRRSKINDRFQMLRQLLPNADQKRDKASFLLEVIEYIRMLHDKVRKYEGLEFRVQQQEPTKALVWDRNCGQHDVTFSPAHDVKEVVDTNGYKRTLTSPLTVVAEDGMTSSGLMCAMALPTARTEQASNHVHQKINPENQLYFNQILVQEDQATTKAKDLLSQKVETLQPRVQQPRNAMILQDPHQVGDQVFPCTRSMDHQNVSTSVFRRSEVEVEGQDRSSQATDVCSNPGSCINKPLTGLEGRSVPGVSEESGIEQRTESVQAKEQELPTVLGGVINISSTYSQGLLDTLTRALQSSGVDMAHATISVQIDLGKPELSSLKQVVPMPSGISPLQYKQMVSTHELEPSYKKLKVEAD